MSLADLAQAAKEAKTALDVGIRRARSEGLTLREIAAETGLTHGGVAYIVRHSDSVKER